MGQGRRRLRGPPGRPNSEVEGRFDFRLLGPEVGMLVILQL